jgi:hypothetical protein
MILTRAVGFKGIASALIQEPWLRRRCIRRLNIPGYTLFSATGMDRPQASILTRNETTWLLPGFSCRDFVPVLNKYTEEEAERQLDVRAIYLPYESEDPPSSKELDEHVRFCEKKTLSCSGVRLRCTKYGMGQY